MAAWKNPENDTPGSGFLGGFTGKTSKMIPWKLTFFFDLLIVWALRKPENPECVVGNFFFDLLIVSEAQKIENPNAVLTFFFDLLIVWGPAGQ